jgi:DNA polymerase beta
MRRKELAEKQRFKASAYKKVIEQLETIPEIRSMEDVRGVTGIGEKIRDKLTEIFSTGALQSAERARREGRLDIYDTLSAIHGIGPAKAKQLMNAGITDLASLRTAVQARPQLLSNIQKAGLKYYEEITRRIPREEILLHEDLLRNIFDAAGLESTVVGSYRRGLPTSGDIDVLVTGDKANFMRGLIDLHRTDYIVETLAEGATKGMYIVRLSPAAYARRVDILYTTPEEYPYAVLYFTGSKEFNVAMRKWALDHGYSLNEHSLTSLSTGEVVEGLATEKNIFDFLGMEWRAPPERVGASAVRAAATTAALAPTQKVIRVPIPVQLQLRKYTVELGKKRLAENDTVYYFGQAGTTGILQIRLSLEHGASSERSVGPAPADLLPFTELDSRRFRDLLARLPAMMRGPSA